MQIELPEKFLSIFEKKARYRVWYGGRGSAKSHSIGRALLIKGMQAPTRVLCCREYQVTIADSSHRLLSDLIKEYGLDNFYDITKSEIRGKNGTLFIFRGIKVDPHGIKSLEGVDVAWVEESEKISNESLDMLIPTIRKPNSEIWFSLNPHKESDPIYQRFIVNPPESAIVERVNFTDNPWFPEVLHAEMEWDKKTNPDKYRWIWLGEPLGLSDAQIFKGKFSLLDFEATKEDQVFFGADWGFAQDPSTLIRMFVRETDLYIEHEAYGVGVEIDELPRLFESVPGAHDWTIYADSARPETISYMQRNGFANIRSVEKWGGSVEDGIAFIKSFANIYIHPRCRHTLQEFELYQYKVDRLTGEVLPIVVDKNNHCIDSIRYGLVDIIKAGGTAMSYDSSIMGYLGL